MNFSAKADIPRSQNNQNSHPITASNSENTKETHIMPCNLRILKLQTQMAGTAKQRTEKKETDAYKEEVERRHRGGGREK